MLLLSHKDGALCHTFISTSKPAGRHNFVYSINYVTHCVMNDDAPMQAAQRYWLQQRTLPHEHFGS